MCDAPNCTVANRTALNWTMRSQTTAYITKSSCEISALIDVSRQLIGPIFKGQEIQNERTEHK